MSRRKSFVVNSSFVVSSSNHEPFDKLRANGRLFDRLRVNGRSFRLPLRVSTAC